VDDELRRRAPEGRWVVTADHCFGRLLLDHAVGGRWYDVLDRRSPASAQLDDDRLAAAVALAERSKDLPAPHHSRARGGALQGGRPGRRER
jgi:hypothetical protein